jgi:hypothetical protein
VDAEDINGRKWQSLIFRGQKHLHLHALCCMKMAKTELFRFGYTFQVTNSGKTVFHTFQAE